MISKYFNEKSFAIGFSILICIVLFCAIGPWFCDESPSELGNSDLSLNAPSLNHLFGTDIFGRDILVRTMHAGRSSLIASSIAVLLSALIGAAIGLISGYGPSWLDRVLMSFTDLMIVFPRLFLVLLLAAVTRPSLTLVIVVIALTGWMSIARIVRSEVLSIKERDYITACTVLGYSNIAIMFRHILPQVLSLILVSISLRLGNTILLESFLSYLGLGVQHPEVSWGAMIEFGRHHLLDAWWIAAIPGVAITLTVISCNLIGDGIQERMDPSRKRGGDSDFE